MTITLKGSSRKRNGTGGKPVVSPSAKSDANDGVSREMYDRLLAELTALKAKASAGRVRYEVLSREYIEDAEGKRIASISVQITHGGKMDGEKSVSFQNWGRMPASKITMKNGSYPSWMVEENKTSIETKEGPVEGYYYPKSFTVLPYSVWDAVKEAF